MPETDVDAAWVFFTQPGDPALVALNTETGALHIEALPANVSPAEARSLAVALEAAAARADGG